MYVGISSPITFNSDGMYYEGDFMSLLPVSQAIENINPCQGAALNPERVVGNAIMVDVLVLGAHLICVAPASSRLDLDASYTIINGIRVWGVSEPTGVAVDGHSAGMGTGAIVSIAAVACAAVLVGVYFMKNQRASAKLPAGVVELSSTVDAPISVYSAPISMDMRPNDAALAAAAAAQTSPA